MTSKDIQLLRRPRPPKHSPSLFMKAESSLTQVHEESRTGRRKEWSDHGNALPSSSLSFLLPKNKVNSFPSRPRRIIPKARILAFLKDDPRYVPPPPEFLLEFLKPNQSEGKPVHTSQSQEEVIQDLSRWNYKKFINHFLFKLHDGQQSEVARMLMSCEQFPPLEHRIPQWQIKCELAAVVLVQLQECVRRQSGFLRHQRNDNPLWMVDETPDACTYTQYDTDPVVLSFQGTIRSHAPSLAPLSPSERAIVDCFEKGGSILNLKAHFIDQLPDVSCLISTLCYLNLSFNDFSLFPVEVCEFTKLEVLKLRGNPFNKIPSKIEKLINLKTLVVSFCKLTALPSQLYHLPSLQHLDVSHNLIDCLSNKIMNLRSLHYLNLEGNLLADLPTGLLRLPLSQLILDTRFQELLRISV